MQKWEYLTVQLKYEGLTVFSSVVPESINGRKAARISMDQLVSQLGEDGWEMTSTISVSRSAAGHYLFFKRK